jgi:GntR family transcriptional regulator, carbon starvation induced regulator
MARATAEAPLTRAEWVDARLREAILSGELRPGEKLRGEHLAAAWGVSPTPLREAFQRLAGEGLVTIEPQRGARVAAIDATDAAELYELRLALDPRALRSAMKVGGDDYRDAIREAYERLSLRHRTISSFLDAHRTFHLATLAACPNRRLHRLVVQLHDQTQRFHMVGGTVRRDGDPRTEHEELFQAVMAGDVRQASTVLAGHLRATLAAVVAQAADGDDRVSPASAAGSR